MYKKIYDWIIKHDLYDKEKIISDIRNNSSILSDEIIPLIYEKNFIYILLDDFKKMLVDTRISILGLDDKNIYFKFKDIKKRIEIELYFTNKKFMETYGKKVTQKNPIIEEKDIILKSRLVVNRENYIIIEEQIENILVGTEYEINLDYENLKYGLEFINVIENTFADRICPHTFFNNQKKNILLENKNAKKDICKVISRINGWRAMSDKKKYDIGDISQKPEYIEDL